MLQPREFAVEPEAANAAQSFAFWLRTVEDLIAYREERREGERPVNKKRVVIICLLPGVYLYVEDAGTYENVVNIPRRIYLKRKITFMPVIYSLDAVKRLKSRYLSTCKLKIPC